MSATEQSDVLRQFVAPENIPKKYGGELDFAFGDEPVLDPILKEQAMWANGHSNFPSGPMYWTDKGDSVECRAVGAQGTPRNEVVATIKKPILQNNLGGQAGQMQSHADSSPSVSNGQTAPQIPLT